MPKRNKPFILLFALIGCAIIALTNPIAKTEKTTSSDKQNQNKEILRQFSIFVEKNEPQVENPPVSNYYRLFEEESAEEPALKKENIENSQLSATNETIKPSANPDQNKTPSLESILAEIDQMAEKIKINFEKSQGKTCSTCGDNQSQTDDSGVPTCAAILAAGGGACNCATLGCTPPDPPWCVHPCCCVCCAACCGL
jgi:hypothetical protein